MNEQVSDAEIAALRERLEALASRVMNGDTTLKIELGIADAELEAMYAVAHNQYMNKRYQEAQAAFSLLLLFDPLEYKYLLGFAACLQMMGQHEAASVTYFTAAAAGPNEPAPYLHMAESLLKMNDTEGAMAALQKVAALVGDNAEYGSYRRQAEAMLENLGQ
jgi:type III secretion system low calcium response chaperone LcrH/SycD